jgi:tungstate transport system permease protein
MNYIISGLFQAIQLLIHGDAETFSAVAATLKVSTGSMIASLLFGIPAGFLLGHHDFPGKKPVRTLVDTLMSLPTVLVGLLVSLNPPGPSGAPEIAVYAGRRSHWPDPPGASRSHCADCGKH